MKVLGVGIVGMGAVFALVLSACGADEDRLVNPPADTADETPPADTDTDTDDSDEPDLSDADQLNSGDTEAGSCDACPTPSMGASCCTIADDVTAIRAVSAGVCGVDMSEFNFPGCTQLAQPGALDTACPDVEIPGFPVMAGCCTESGHCGAMETYMGFGCTRNPDPNTWVACGG